MYTPKRRSTMGGGPASGGGDESSFFMRASNSPYKTLNISMSSEKEETINKTYNKNGTFQVIEQGDSHQLLSYGTSLPVEVAKVLSSNEKVSCNIDPSGWAAVVSHRKIYTWRYMASSIKKMVSCFELHLSPTELSHSAKLSCILQEVSQDASLNTKVSVMNISPEGSVRYWQNITRPSMMIETNIDLGGKQCHKLLPLKRYGCILLTTTNELYLLTPTMVSISCSQINSTNGMLSNIGRRVSSFWSQPAVDASEEFLPCICEGTLDRDQFERYFYVAIKGSIQKWMTIGTQPTDTKLLFEAPLMKHLKKKEFSFEWDDINDVQVIDMQNTGFGVVLLIALWKDDETYFSCLATMKAHSAEDITIDNVNVIQYDLKNVDPNSLKLILPLGGYEAFVCTNNLILSQSVAQNMKNLISIEFNMTNNMVLGGGSCGTESIFLTKRHGLVTLKVQQHQPSMLMDPIPTIKSSVEHNQTEVAMDNIETNNDIQSIVKNAFIKYSKNENNITNLSEYTSRNNGDEINVALESISHEILNSLPATDTRWASASSQEKSSLQPTSVLLLNQLNDKIKIFETYLKFLETSNIFEIDGNVKDRIHCSLCEHGEKLMACLTLLNLYPENEQLINRCISSANKDVSSGKNNKDKFFSKVTDIDYFFMLLIKNEEVWLKELKAIKEQVELVASISTVITDCYTASWEYRQNYENKYQLSQNIQVPWTGRSEGVNNRELLKLQINFILKQALPNVDSIKNGNILSRNAMLLSDILLDAYEKQLNLKSTSLDQYAYDTINEEFYYQRENICTSFVNQNYHEQALQLAKKYEDFSMLITICEKLNNQEKLNEYKVLFQNQGFNDVLYKYYMDKGAWGRLMSLENASADYDKFLTNHNTLSWLHFIGSKDFSKASNVLKDLAEKEQANVDKKKMMLILSNLSMLASSEDTTVIANIVTDSDTELELIEYQNNIMKHLQRNDTTPLTAEDLLKVCLSDDSNIIDEKYYILLLDLLTHIDNDSESFGQAVWNKIVSVDRWDDQPMLDYTAIVTQKVIYKCLTYLINRDSLHLFLPSLNNLLISTENDLSQTCQTQIKACYESLQIGDAMIVT